MNLKTSQAPVIAVVGHLVKDEIVTLSLKTISPSAGQPITFRPWLLF